MNPAEFSPSSTDVYAVYSQEGQLVGASSNRPTTVISQVHNGFRNIRGKSHTSQSSSAGRSGSSTAKSPGAMGCSGLLRLCEITIT